MDEGLAGVKNQQAPNPWISKAIYEKHVATLQDRAAESEACLTRLLAFIDPEILDRHGNDWKAAVEELCA